MNSPKVFIVTLMLLVAASTPLLGATLSVVVKGAKSKTGKIKVALAANEQEYKNPKSIRQAQQLKDVEPVDGDTKVVFEGLPSGRYALLVFHDENDNNDLDTNIVGYPTERYGFSNDARAMFGPPSFGDAAFDIAESKISQTVSIK